MTNLLLVDDERMFLMSLSESLMQTFNGMKVLTAENGEEAMRILNTLPVDFLLTDLQMPVMDGFDLLMYVKEFYPHIPVVVMTAYLNEDIMRRLCSLGFTDVIEKPIEFDVLAGRIKNKI